MVTHTHLRRIVIHIHIYFICKINSRMTFTMNRTRVALWFQLAQIHNRIEWNAHTAESLYTCVLITHKFFYMDSRRCDSCHMRIFAYIKSYLLFLLNAIYCKGKQTNWRCLKIIFVFLYFLNDFSVFFFYLVFSHDYCYFMKKLMISL